MAGGNGQQIAAFWNKHGSCSGNEKTNRGAHGNAAAALIPL
jgi:hypothetical protein